MIGSFRLPVSLTSGGTSAPTIISAKVEDANPDKLVVVFSEPINITDVTGLTITGDVTPTLSVPTGGGTDTITFTLSAALTNGQAVTLNVASSNTIEDTASNALAATTKEITNNVAVVSTPLILDTYTDSVGGYSVVRRLRNAYAGAAIRVRESLNNTEQDIGFDANGLLDESALTTFVGANDGFVTKIYGQSINIIDLSQTSASFQPKIVEAGVVLKEGGKPTVIFENSYMEASGFGTDNARSIYIVETKKGDIGDGYDNLFIFTNSFTTTNNFMQIYSTIGTLIYNFPTDDLDSTETGSSYTTGFTKLLAINKSTSGVNYRINGVQESSKIGTQSLDDKFFLGAWRSNFAHITFQEAIIWNDDRTADAIGIESNINSFYTIY